MFRAFPLALAVLVLAAAAPALAQTAAPVPAAPESCGCEGPALPAVLAIVNGAKIAAADVEQPLAQEIATLRQQVVDARAYELTLQINASLLRAEAKKRGVTEGELLQQEVLAKVAAPVEADARAFYEKNRARLAADFDDAKAEILEYLVAQRRIEQGGASRAACGRPPG